MSKRSESPLSPIGMRMNMLMHLRGRPHIIKARLEEGAEDDRRARGPREHREAEPDERCGLQDVHVHVPGLPGLLGGRADVRHLRRRQRRQ